MANRKWKNGRWLRGDDIVASYVFDLRGEAIALCLARCRDRYTFGFYKMLRESDGKIRFEHKGPTLPVEELPQLAAAAALACIVARNRGVLPPLAASDELTFARFQSAWKAACEAVPDLQAASSNVPLYDYGSILSQIVWGQVTPQKLTAA